MRKTLLEQLEEENRRYRKMERLLFTAYVLDLLLGIGIGILIGLQW